MPVHYTDLQAANQGVPFDTLICNFNSLAPNLKDVARADVMFVDSDCHRESIALWKSVPIHARINNRGSFYRMVRIGNHIARTHSDPDYLDSYIVSNVTTFDVTTGAYVVYALDK